MRVSRARVGSSASATPGNKPSLVRALNALGPWRSLTVIVVMLLAVVWLALAVIFGLVPVGPGLTNRVGGVAAGDFIFFYSAGVLAGEGRAALVYDPEALTNVARTRLRPRVPELVWPYPPTMSLPLTLLGRFPPGAALALWVGGALGSLLGLARLVLGGWRLTPIALLFPASGFALFTGQFSPVLGLLLGVFFLGAARPSLTGGMALGLLVWKPHFALVPAAFALYGRQRRTLVAAALTACAIVLLSLAVFGLEAWTRFFEAGVRHSGVLDREAPIPRFVTPFAAAYTHGAGVRLALALHFITASLACGAGLWLWTRATRPSVRALGLTGATLQLMPYALDYDLVFLLLPWLLMIREAREDSRASLVHFWPWLGLTLLVPVGYLTQLYTFRSITGPILFAIVCLSWWRTRVAETGPQA